MTRAQGRNGRRVMTDSNKDETKDREFFSVFDGTKGRPESTYLDMQERERAEILRAKAEGREPDLDEGNLGPAVGTVLVIKEQQVDNSHYANPPVGSGHVEAKEVDPLQTLPVSVGQADVDVDLSSAAQIARERKSEDDALLSGKSSTDGSGGDNASASATKTSKTAAKPTDNDLLK